MFLIVGVEALGSDDGLLACRSVCAVLLASVLGGVELWALLGGLVLLGVVGLGALDLRFCPLPLYVGVFLPIFK